FRVDERSPYFDAERHTYAIFAQGEQTGSDPQVVAEAIEAAIDDPERRFRYRVTPDAPGLIGGRGRMTAEEWVAMGRHSSDEAYSKEFAARFPIGKPAEPLFKISTVMRARELWQARYPVI